MKSEYSGKVQNQGTQFVPAPAAKKSGGSKTRVIRGEDLRNGNRKTEK